ncbi:MAG: 4Fe-4S binding protein [Candidatus Methanoplasma sp.]|jgi:ferredoxin|nr:4Fe-4S binding protein [Candidatus Methanoplasma sp.]
MEKGIVIDEFKCDGCGLCVEACHEGALAVIGGKAKLIGEDICDGLGDCLPACPKGAISFIELCGCEAPRIIMPGAPPRSLTQINHSQTEPGSSELRQWPVKLRLVYSASPIFKGADLLLAADCSAFACSKIHEDLIKGRAVTICCPKFDTGLAEKLVEVLSNNSIGTLTVARMTVPCCTLDRIARDALARSGKDIPLTVLTIDQRGCVRETG